MKYSKERQYNNPEKRHIVFSLLIIDQNNIDVDTVAWRCSHGKSISKNFYQL